MVQLLQIFAQSGQETILSPVLRRILCQSVSRRISRQSSSAKSIVEVILEEICKLVGATGEVVSALRNPRNGHKKLPVFVSSLPSFLVPISPRDH
ncbi:unnamed protein product [Allacma fusca]|uniref:Uncharacterized protein n=1 Tax=Allacma fusca TaxID=39272 RepID=A0A8J2L372_9HEXA|nr:unnamed protein product [Allacma fusca]